MWLLFPLMWLCIVRPQFWFGFFFLPLLCVFWSKGKGLLSSSCLAAFSEVVFEDQTPEDTKNKANKNPSTLLFPTTATTNHHAMNCFPFLTFPLSESKHGITFLTMGRAHIIWTMKYFFSQWLWCYRSELFRLLKMWWDFENLSFEMWLL